MKDQLPKNPNKLECGILNLETSREIGSHWVGYAIKDGVRYYFDSYGEPPPSALEKYLKSRNEYQNQYAVIRSSAVTTQKDGTTECGSLCLYVLHHLMRGISYDQILTKLKQRYKDTPSPSLIVSRLR